MAADLVDFLGTLCIGALLGMKLEAWHWRSKGDHEYMNLKESAGKLYVVKREEAMTPAHQGGK